MLLVVHNLQVNVTPWVLVNSYIHFGELLRFHLDRLTALIYFHRPILNKVSARFAETSLSNH